MTSLVQSNQSWVNGKVSRKRRKAEVKASHTSLIHTCWRILPIGETTLTASVSESSDISDSPLSIKLPSSLIWILNIYCRTSAVVNLDNLLDMLH